MYPLIHDAYLKNFGYLHKKRDYFFKKDSNLKGTDELVRKETKKF